MKTTKSSSLVLYGLLLGLAGSLFLNVFQLNKYNRRLASLSATESADTDWRALQNCQAENARKDSLLVVLEEAVSGGPKAVRLAQ